MSAVGGTENRGQILSLEGVKKGFWYVALRASVQWVKNEVRWNLCNEFIFWSLVISSITSFKKSSLLKFSNQMLAYLKINPNISPPPTHTQSMP